MIRLAAPQPGEVIVDPMCGGATIPMEVKLMTYLHLLYLIHSHLSYQKADLHLSTWKLKNYHNGEIASS